MSTSVAQALLQSMAGVVALVDAGNITVGAVAKSYAGTNAIVVNANGGTAAGAMGRSRPNIMVHVYAASEASAEAICAAIRDGLRGTFDHGGVTAAGVRVHGVEGITMPTNAPERYEQSQFTKIFTFTLKLWEG